MVMEHLRVNGGILGKLDTIDVADVICIVFLFQQIIRRQYIYIYIFDGDRR